MAILRRRMRFDLIARITIAASIAQLASVISLALIGASYMSMAWASLIGMAVTLAGLVLARAPHIMTLPSFRGWQGILLFGGVSSLTSIISKIGMALPDLILGRLIGFSAVAFYSRANGLTRVVGQTVNSTVANVMQSHFAHGNRTQPIALKMNYLRGTEMLTSLIWPCLLFLGVFAQPVILFVYGDQWLISAPVLSVLCIAMAIYFLVALSGPMFLGLGAIRMDLWRELIIQGSRAVFILYAAQIGLIAVAWALVATYVVAVAVSVVFLHQLIGLTINELILSVWRSLGVTVLSALSCGLGVIFFSFEGAALWWQLPVMGVLFILNWLVAIFLVKHPLKQELQLIWTKLRWFRE